MYICTYMCVYIYTYIIYIYLSDTHECRPLKKMLQTFSVPDKSLAIDSFFIYKTFKYTSRGKKKTNKPTKNTAANKTLSTNLIAIFLNMRNIRRTAKMQFLLSRKKEKDCETWSYASLGQDFREKGKKRKQICINSIRLRLQT